MEKDKNNYKGVIALLIAIIVILSTLCILFATGIISFKSNDIDNNKNITGDNNIESDVNTNDNKKFKLKNNDVTEVELNEVFNILGLNEYYHSNQYETFDENKECLNNYISQNDFRNNNKEIFAWYALTHDMYTNTGQTEIIYDTNGDGQADVTACAGAADCGSIKKSDANKIIELYKLTNIEEYLDEMPEPYKNIEYIINYHELTGMHPIMCNIKIEHNIEAEYNESKNIVIIDRQNVLEYGSFEESDQIKTKKERVVTYNFKKDNNNKFYLDNVNVK